MAGVVELDHDRRRFDRTGVRSYSANAGSVHSWSAEMRRASADADRARWMSQVERQVMAEQELAADDDDEARLGAAPRFAGRPDSSRGSRSDVRYSPLPAGSQGDRGPRGATHPRRASRGGRSATSVRPNSRRKDASRQNDSSVMWTAGRPSARSGSTRPAANSWGWPPARSRRRQPEPPRRPVGPMALRDGCQLTDVDRAPNGAGWRLASERSLKRRAWS